MAAGKKIRKAYENINRDAFYKLDDAVKIIKSNATAKFDETIEIAINLELDVRHSDQQVRGVVERQRRNVLATVRLAAAENRKKAVPAVAPLRLLPVCPFTVSLPELMFSVNWQRHAFSCCLSGKGPQNDAVRHIFPFFQACGDGLPKPALQQLKIRADIRFILIRHSEARNSHDSLHEVEVLLIVIQQFIKVFRAVIVEIRSSLTSIPDGRDFEGIGIGNLPCNQGSSGVSGSDGTDRAIGCLEFKGPRCPSAQLKLGHERTEESCAHRDAKNGVGSCRSRVQHRPAVAVHTTSFDRISVDRVVIRKEQAASFLLQCAAFGQFRNNSGIDESLQGGNCNLTSFPCRHGVQIIVCWQLGDLRMPHPRIQSLQLQTGSTAVRHNDRIQCGRIENRWNTSRQHGHS